MLSHVLTGLENNISYDCPISVLSMGPGREEENGKIAPMPHIKVGDYVIAKNPWGIGPKDEETADGKKLSFMRAQDIAAVCGSVQDD